jgi:MerR family glutamine synthetase transcriptional repressor
MTLIPRDMAVLTIGIVQQLTGLTLRQIRYYEQNGLLETYRSPGRQRLFSLNNVERLMEIKSLLEAGYTIPQIKKILAPADAPEAPAQYAGEEDRPGEPKLSDIRAMARQQLTDRGYKGGSLIDGELSRFLYRPKK